MQIALQRGGGEADVDAIDVGDDVAEEREADESPRHARDHYTLSGGRQSYSLRHRAAQYHATVSETPQLRPEAAFDTGVQRRRCPPLAWKPQASSPRWRSGRVTPRRIP